MSKLVEELTTEEKMSGSRIVTEGDSDLDEELIFELKKAVQTYKTSKEKGNAQLVINSESKERIPKTEEPKVGENQQKYRPRKNPGNFKKTPFTEQVSGNLNARTHGALAKFFGDLTKDPKEVPKRKTYRDYINQGAIPKGRYRFEGRKKFGDNFNFNPHCKNYTSFSELGSKPFFYIVPENPSPNFFLPQGSYFVIPAHVLSSPSATALIIHPENSNSPARGMCGTKPGSKPNVAHSYSGANNLGKETPCRTDSHLNITPAPVKENSFVQNLKNNYNVNKRYGKTLMKESPQGSHALPSDEDDDNFSVKSTKSRNTESIYTSLSSIVVSEEEEEAQDKEKLHNAQQRLMSEFPNLDVKSAKKFANRFCMDERSLEDFIASRRISEKIKAQYKRMVEALPESSTAELREKAAEFGGDEEKEIAYVEEIKHRNKCQQLLTEMQLVLPDAEPNFLLEAVEELKDDPVAVNTLTNKLLESNDYPKISTSERNTLWRSYVTNFSVKEYLLKVPDPEKFAGPAGDDNKTDENLIMRFLKARYPEASEPFLENQFLSHNRNITQTCASMVQSRTVRLSECRLEHENLNENFLKEICYIDHRDEIDAHKEEMKLMKETEMLIARLDNAFLFCPLCSDDELIPSEAVTCPEGHVFCKECIKRYIEVKISDAVYKFTCPMENCNVFFTMGTVEELMPPNVCSIIVWKQQAEELMKAEVEGLEFCLHCEFAYIPNPEDKIFKCRNPSCLTETCRKCHEENHIPLRCEEIERVMDVAARKKIEETMTEKLIRRCPQCGKGFVKTDGCNKMACPCGAIVCYICRKRVDGYQHFQKGTTVPGSGMCPLYSNNEDLHIRQVIEAGLNAKTRLVTENPEIRIVHDPTTSRFP